MTKRGPKVKKTRQKGERHPWLPAERVTHTPAARAAIREQERQIGEQIREAGRR